MENIMTQYGGEIITALFMLIIMLVILLILFNKSIGHSHTSLGMPRMERQNFGQSQQRNAGFLRGNSQQYQQNTRQSETWWGLLMVAVFVAVLLAALFFFRTNIQPEPSGKELSSAKLSSQYPSIGLNKANSYVAITDLETEEAHEPGNIVELKGSNSAPTSLADDLQDRRRLPTSLQYTCQVAAFTDQEKAEEELKKWAAKMREDVFLAIEHLENGTASYKVLIGKFTTREEARSLATRIGIGYVRDQESLSPFRP